MCYISSIKKITGKKKKVYLFITKKNKKMKEIFEEFGSVGAPSMYEITLLIYGDK